MRVRVGQTLAPRRTGWWGVSRDVCGIGAWRLTSVPVESVRSRPSAKKKAREQSLTGRGMNGATSNDQSERARTRHQKARMPGT